MTNAPVNTKPLVTLETKTELLINLPGITTPDQKEKQNKFIEMMSGDDEKFERVIRHLPHLLNCSTSPVVLRIATPRELGCKQDLIFGFWVDSLAERNNLKHCHDSDAIRLAFQLSEIKSSIPQTSAQTSWRIHMRPIDFEMSGDMFISGLGCPDPVFEINPHFPKVLSVKWIYQGQNRGACLDDPIVFRKSP